MLNLKNIIQYCNQYTKISKIIDFPGAKNGLQIENNGKVTKIGAAVDASLETFKLAINKKIDLLIVHHGLYWNPPQPITGINYKKIFTLIKNNLAIYSCHLPLDLHPKIGNNACIARILCLDISGWFFKYKGNLIGILSENLLKRSILEERLKSNFPKTYKAITYGPEKIKKIAICSGDGSNAFSEILNLGIDAFITGEIRQNYFSLAQDHKINLYPCGHYATEIFGVQALADKVSKYFSISWEFISNDCVL